MLMVNIFDSIKVSEEEAYTVYKKNDWNDIQPELINIAEVLTDSLEIVETVLNELSEGKNIKDLAKQYTKRDSLKERGGEFGFFPMTKHGAIGRIASRMEIGEVYGPLKLDNGYSVFQLIDKKKDSTHYSKSYDEVKEELITHLTLIKFEKYINEYNALLAEKYGVEIYEDVLKGIENIFVNLVVVRYMGFGSEIFAVPYTEQFSGWYDIWLLNKDLMP
jgi:foldase protein PrsA